MKSSFSCELSKVLLSCDYSHLQNAKQGKPYSLCVLKL